MINPHIFSWLHDVKTDKLYFYDGLDSHTMTYEQNCLRSSPGLIQLEWLVENKTPQIRAKKNSKEYKHIEKYIQNHFPTRTKFKSYLAKLCQERFQNVKPQNMFSFLSHWPGVTAAMQLNYLDHMKADDFTLAMVLWTKIPKALRKSWYSKLNTQNQLFLVGTPGELFSLDECRKKILPFLTGIFAYNALCSYRKLTLEDKLLLCNQMHEQYLGGAFGAIKDITDQQKLNICLKVQDSNIRKNLKSSINANIWPQY